VSIGGFPHGLIGLVGYICLVSLQVSTAFVLLGVFGALLGVFAVRIGLHELCHRFDGERTRPPGGGSINPYWLTFRSTHDVTLEQDREAFHDRAANFPTLELALHDSTRVNADREARGQPLYTVVRSSDGTEWSLERGMNGGALSLQESLSAARSHLVDRLAAVTTTRKWR
jgi:hypothetical protein